MWYEDDMLLGDSWSLCAWTVRHVIRHHVSKMEGLYASLFGDCTTKNCLVFGSERRRRCEELLA